MVLFLTWFMLRVLCEEDTSPDLLSSGFAFLCNVALDKNPEVTFSEVCQMFPLMANDKLFLHLGETILEIERTKRKIAGTIPKASL